MKIAIAQINTTVGDFKGNLAKILDRISWAEANLTDIVVFPEMAVTGYPPQDLLEEPHFIKENLKFISKIKESVGGKTAVIVGFVSINESAHGKGLHNSAAFIHDGKIKLIQHKTLLPTYDVFDEYRYFEPAKEQHLVNFKGKKIGITICEDIWFSEDVRGRKLYKTDPVAELAKSGADVIINISASPYVLGKRAVRRKMLKSVATKYSVPVIYANLVGGNDELIFDGSSVIVGADGKVLAECGVFVEDAVIADLEKKKGEIKGEVLTEAEEIYRALVLGVRDYAGKCGFTKAVIGLSGGIDSAVVAAIAADALGAENILGVTMPTRYSSKESVTDSKKLAENIGICFKEIAIDDTFQNYLDLLEPHFEGKKPDETEENLQARVRGNILMAFSNKFGAIVLSTGNKSEMAVGYCTLYGDLAGGLAVISDVPKTVVYKLAEHINREKKLIPPSIIKRPPSAELRPNQTDQDTLPPYDVLDQILKLFVEGRKSAEEIVAEGFDKKIVADVIGKMNSSEYKRNQAPLGLKITTKAFGWGRRRPIACKY